MIKMTNNEKTNFQIYRLARAESERLRLDGINASETAKSVLNAIAIGNVAKPWKHSPFEHSELNDCMAELLSDIQVAQDKFQKRAESIHEQNKLKIEKLRNEIDGLTKLLYKQGVYSNNLKLSLSLLGNSATFENAAEMYKRLNQHAESGEFKVLDMDVGEVLLACPGCPEAFNKLSFLVSQVATELKVSVGGIKKIGRNNISFEFDRDKIDDDYYAVTGEYPNEAKRMEVDCFIHCADSKYLAQYNKLTNFGENIPEL